MSSHPPTESTQSGNSQPSPPQRQQTQSQLFEDLEKELTAATATAAPAPAAPATTQLSAFNFDFTPTNSTPSTMDPAPSVGYPHGPPEDEPPEEHPPPYSRFEASPHLLPTPEAARWAPRRGVLSHRYHTDLEGGFVHPGVRRMNTVTLDDLRDDAAREETRRRREAWRKRWEWGGEMTPEKRRRVEKARHWCFIVVLMVTVLVVSIVGGVVGSRAWKKPSEGDAQAQADGADAEPTLPLGLAVVRPYRVAERLSTCAPKSYQWSCTLPADTRVPTTTGSNDNLKVPEFQFMIKKRDAGSNSDPESDWIPVPRAVPNTTDYENVASVDEVGDAGEESELYVTLITKSDSNTNAAGERGIVREPSHMLPFAVANQPLRLFDRGLESEHFGFHVYYDKTIQFANSSQPKETQDKGGVTAKNAGYRVQWSNTRFKVTIFTKQSPGRTLDTGADAGTVLDMPVDIWEDRVGGDRQSRTISAWELDKNGAAQRKVGIPEKDGIWAEERGCYCRWSNYLRS